MTSQTPGPVVIHRGLIPGTGVGHHWFDAADGNRYGIQGWPHGLNKGWAYEVVDDRGNVVDDSMFSHAEIREWAAHILPPSNGGAS